MPYRVFVSYSTKDFQNVNDLRTFLQVPEVECFVSEYAVTPGVPLAPTIKNAILACDLFVLLWSKNAAESEWVPQEIGIAHGNKKPIMPLVLHEGISLPGFIKDLRYVEAYKNKQASLYGLREYVLKNSLLKKNQQNILGALAVGGILLLLLKAGSE